MKIGASKFEKAWDKLPEGHRLISKRSSEYDALTGILYFPTLHNYTPINNKNFSLPDDKFIRNSFVEFVRGELGSEQKSRGPHPFLEPVRRENIDILPIAKRYLKNCEEELIYSGIIDAIKTKAGSDMIAQIYQLLCDARIGNKDNLKNVSFEFFKTKVQASLKKKDRLLFILPSFPFKDQNIFRTECPAHHLDLGEIALLIRLHIISLALYQVHPYGADWIILSDGNAYSETLGVNKDDAENYFDKLKYYRNELNLQNTVTIIDLKDLANKISSENTFNKTQLHIYNRLKSFLDKKDNFNKYFNILHRGMKWNKNNKLFFSENSIGHETAWRILDANQIEDVHNDERKLLKELNEQIIHTSLEYSSFNLALRFFNFYEIFFPTAIKATVHPKINQIGVPSFGGVSPWNGVCLVHDLDFKPFAISSIELYKLMGLGEKLVALCDRGSNYPMFYLKKK